MTLFVLQLYNKPYYILPLQSKMGSKFFTFPCQRFIVLHCNPIVVGRHSTTIVGTVPASSIWANWFQKFPVTVKYVNFRIISNTFYVPGFISAVSVGRKVQRIIDYEGRFGRCPTAVPVPCRDMVQFT